VKREIDAEARAGGADPTGGLGNMFNDPSMIQKLASNPKTSGLLGDADFMRKLQTLKQNPNAIGEALQDPRMLQVMSVLLGVDMQFGAPPGAEDAGASTKPTEAEEDVPMPDLKPAKEEQKAPEPEPEPEPEDEEAIAKREAKAKADEEKRLGTENYKKRNFDAAIAHYSKAWELYKDITYLTNLGAAKFEKGDYQGAIEACKQAVDYGREVLADFKLIAK
jgi:stress-induced-phosphoprotein 1